MRVIKRPEDEAQRVVCGRCGCIIEYDEDDIEVLLNGTGFYCPNCSEEIILNKNIKAHQWPEAFYYFSKNANAVTVSDEKTQQFIYDTVKRLNEIDVGEVTCIATGDTIVIGIRWADSKNIIVAKDYWCEDYDFVD